MAVLQMQKISICALKKNRKAILETLQSMGAMEMITQDLETEEFETLDVTGQRAAFDRNAAQADQALDILQSYVPENTSLLSSLAGKKLIERKSFYDAINRQDKHMSVAKKIIACEKQIAECKANIQRMENQRESLTPWLSLDVPMNFEGTRLTSFLLGTMAPDITLEKIYSILAEQAPEASSIDVTIVSQDRDLSYVTVICMKADEAIVEEALRTNGFAKPSQVIADIPTAMVKQIEEDIVQEQGKISQATQAIEALADKREILKTVSDYYRIRAQKYELLGTIPHTKETFFVEGYVPAQKADKVLQVMSDKFQAVAETEDIAEEEETPILLKNNKFSTASEPILESYGLPHKGEVDPTTIMSVFYVFFFGLMLSDAAYGFIISLVCGILILKFPRMSSGMKKSIQLFFWCGLSTLCWGVLFGGYFGDIVDVVAKNYFGVDVSIKALWFVPLNNPMKLLVYSMLFGTIHLFVGLGIKGYMLLRDKLYKDFVCDIVFLYALLIGLILILLPSDIFASIAQTKIVFPASITLLSKILAIGGAIGVLLFAGRSSKNPGLRLALGAYELYNLTGWLSDVLSYSRLLALGLATGVIASVVNQMGSMVGTGIFGTLIFIVVFIIGHVFNMAINLLGAYVHTNRLQYVEFFGKFYEGGGRPFNPFKSNTKYVDIKKEDLSL
ncbi:MAG: V-type ATP synthase subunit I [Lachnospiraceae bacterium]|nr:V-type ATP synthase subunit I [Lachnospiraceae bacterium]MDD3614738.1 V-type ATP synthase subunit I [Lachnospiraceae bacterium]